MLAPNPVVLASVIAREYQLREAGSPLTFVAMYRLIAGLTGLPKQQCLTTAATMFPHEWETYRVAVHGGIMLPPLDREEYQQRRVEIIFGSELN